MKTLEETKNQYAKENGYNNFDDMCVGCYGAYVSDHIDEIANRHAIEVAKQTLINVCENAETEDYPDPEHGGYGAPNYFTRVNKESILNESNIPKLCY